VNKQPYGKKNDSDAYTDTGVEVGLDDDHDICHEDNIQSIMTGHGSTTYDKKKNKFTLKDKILGESCLDWTVA